MVIMIILLDMDDVLADFDGEFFTRWRAQYPDKPYIAKEDRKIFGLDEEYPPELKDLVKSVYTAPGFCKSLPPIPGSLEAVLEMKQEGHDVFICTAPLSKYENCVLEKYEWTEKHLGREWTKKIILTKDKTLVRGDFLIDDNPDIKGIATPSWEYIIFDQPYNRNITDKRRLKSLKDWKSILVKP